MLYDAQHRDQRRHAHARKEHAVLKHDVVGFPGPLLGIKHERFTGVDVLRGDGDQDAVVKRIEDDQRKQRSEQDVEDVKEGGLLNRAASRPADM